MSGFSGFDLAGLSVRRPTLIVVANLLIILAGVGAWMGVDVRELPSVDIPIVTIRANLSGASPETLDTEVTSVLEKAVSRVSGLTSVRSSSEEGNMRIRAEFSTDTDLNTAANDVREAVSRSSRNLPDDLENLEVVKADDDARPVVELAVASSTMLQDELYNTLETTLVPELLSISGVADVTLSGYRERQLKIELDPSAMQARSVDLAQIKAALATLSFDTPVGSLQAGSKELMIRAQAKDFDIDAIRSLPLNANTTLTDVASVSYGLAKRESYALMNSQMVIGVEVVRRPGANTIAISNAVKEKISTLERSLDHLQISVTADDATFIKSALKEVLLTLVAAVLIVLVVVGLFLNNWRALLIPAVTLPVSLIGTLAGIWALGFSINLLTLLALVLATGLVVDDAIVVLENIERRKETGEGALAASVLGTRQVFFAVVATTITLISVFLPIAFLSGRTGSLFREFGFTLAISVAISSFVALTLAPLIASRLKPSSQTTHPIKLKMASWGRQVSSSYLSSVSRWVTMPKTAALVLCVLMLGGGAAALNLHNELLPSEARGQIRIQLTLPDGSALSATDDRVQEVERQLAQRKEILSLYTVVGWRDKNRALIVATVKPEFQAQELELNDQLNQSLKVTDAQLRIEKSSGISFGDSGGGVQVAVLGGDYQSIYQSALELKDALTQNLAQVTDVRINYDLSQPETRFEIDRAKAADLGVSLDQVGEYLNALTEESQLFELSIEDQSVPVVISHIDTQNLDVSRLLSLSIPTDSGSQVSLRDLVKVTNLAAAAELDRQAQRRSIELNLRTSNNQELGPLIDQIQQVANQTLKPNQQLLFLGEAASLEENNQNTLLVFLLALLVVFLVLSAQFESFGSAVIVMLTVPFGLASTALVMWLLGLSLNLYTQIALIMLLGLMTKNAILLVEFMDQLRAEGASVSQAVLEGAKVRLRPVTMTVLSTAVGAVPLILSQGSGAEARHAIGWVIFAGLLASSVITLYVTPLAYQLIAPFMKSRSHYTQALQDELAQHS